MECYVNRRIHINVKKIILLITLILTLSCLSLAGASFAADYLEAPGGAVTTAEEFVAALGGEDAALSKDNRITLISDISLTAPIYLKSGDYTLNGAGCHIDLANDMTAMFEIASGASLTIGNEKGSDDHPSQTFNGAGHTGLFADIKGGELVVEVGTLVDGFDSTHGAFRVDGGSLTMNAGIVSNCKSSENGGAVNLLSGKASLTGATFKNNTALADGGAIFCGGGELTFVSCPTAENTAMNGGAIAIHGGSATVGGITFDKNTASDKGGAFYCGVDGELSLVEVYAGYSTAKFGGAIYNEGVLVLGSGQISYNNAEIAAGVYNTGDMTLIDMTISDNEASVMVGGVYNAGNFVMNGGDVSSNKTYGRCGGLFNLGTFYMNEGGISSNKFKTESKDIEPDYKYGQGIENWGKMTLAEHAFISFNNDVLVGSYKNADGSIYRAEVIIESVLTANTPIATFTPIYCENGYESDDFVLDFEEGRKILTGEADILVAAAEKLAMSNDTKRTWKLDEFGAMLKDGYVNGNPLILAVILISAAVVLIGVGTGIIIYRKKKNKSPQ